MRFFTTTSAYSLFSLLGHVALSHQAMTLRGSFDGVDNEHNILLPVKPTNGGKNAMISLPRATTEDEVSSDL